MKKIITLFILLCCCTAMMVLGKSHEKKRFSLSGELSGAAAGDTLRFIRIEFPGFVRTPGFDVIVGKAGKFRYRGSQSHASLYIMQYIPVKGTAPRMDRQGKSLFICPSDRLSLTGERNKHAFCIVNGGIYDDPTLRRKEMLEDSLGWCRTSLLQQQETALKAGDSLGAKAAADAFNSFRSGEAGRRIDSLREAYAVSPGASELAAVWLLQESTSSDPVKLSDKFALLPASVQKSYHGMLLNEQVTRALALLPGQPAPDFTLVSADGKKISHDDFKGRYLLICHWGGCPGSMQAEPRVRALYDKTSRERWTVIGVTSGRSDVERIHAAAGPSELFFDINLKERTEEMLNHPYPDYDLNLDGNDIDKRYMFGGLPFFVLISPEGTILARGFHEALQVAADLAE